MGLRDVPSTARGLDHNFLTGKLEDLVKWSAARAAEATFAWPAAPSR